MASNETVELNAPHAPHANAIEAFHQILPKIKAEILKSRHHWDKHEPRMWSRANGLSDHQLTTFDLEKDLVEIRSGLTSYGTIIFGKIRIPAVNDEGGEGFVLVRIHDPPNRGTEDIIFHSIFTDETTWQAIQNRDFPIQFFSE